MKIALRFGLALAIAVSSAALSQAQEKKQLVFVVNGASDFWKIAEAGVRKAQEEMPNFDMQLKYPEQAAAAIQQRLMDDLVAAGADAIMVSAVDPNTVTEALNRVAAQVPLFTTDSDAPDSKRIAYGWNYRQHRAWQKCRRVDEKVNAGRRQMYRFRRPPRRR